MKSYPPHTWRANKSTSSNAGNRSSASPAKYNTTIDCMMHLNSMMELQRHPARRRTRRHALEFPPPHRAAPQYRLRCGTAAVSSVNIRSFTSAPCLAPPQRGTISSKIRRTRRQARPTPVQGIPRRRQGRSRSPSPPCKSAAWDGDDEKPAGGILLRPQDMEEISLLTRVGNEVEIR